METTVQTDTSGLETRALSSALGVEVLNIDLATSGSDALAPAFIDLFNRAAVVAFRGQSLSPERLIAFSRHFGPLEPHTDFEHLLPGHREIMLVGNVAPPCGGQPFFHNAMEEWHTDLIQTQTPNAATVLYAIESPPAGATTRFIDARAAYDALPQTDRNRVDAMQGVYDIVTFDNEMRRQDPHRPPLTEEKIRRNPPVSHPIARTHPVTGAKSLYFAADIIARIDGMSDEESRSVVDGLLSHASQPEFVYAHRWKDGDVVIWDNRCTLHTATPFDADKYRRLLYRTVIAGETPY